jgi:hypothetical protein
VLARLIDQRADDEGGRLPLMSCRTGANGATAAQNLANKLGVAVMAPSDTLWAWVELATDGAGSGPAISPVTSGRTT